MKADQRRHFASSGWMISIKQTAILQRAMLLGVIWGLFGPAAAEPAKALSVHHHLSVRLDPAARKLMGTARMKIRPQGTDTAVFFMAPQTRLKAVTIDSKPVSLALDRDGRLRVPLDSAASSGSTTVTVRYEAVFNDPFPVKPVNVDNPGYGVVGTIGRQGALLLAGAGWYPMAANGRETFLIEVTAPAGMIAVTAGASEGVTHRDDQTVSHWRVQHPIDGLALSAGRYQVTEKPLGHVTAATYFFPQSQHLADTYLDAVAGYLTLYEALFGPYPFEKFAVVENFFPTGYGFPSYTLLGTRVLQLPFIVRTSLGHEIAHCWWGNSVYVDSGRGNWAEGLTTYVADYLYKERTSSAAALEHRRQMLRNYATLVPPDADFPLANFRSRTDPVTKVIGYDKGAFVFHMLRRQLGDDAFWAALQDVYRDKLFKRASWLDFQAAFEKRADRSLEGFFRQWIRREGAPRLTLQDVTRQQSASQWQVRGTLQQEGTVYDGTVQVQLDTVNGRQTESVRLINRETDFIIQATSKPVRLSVDEDVHFFRRLAPTEIPPTVNSLKSARSVVVVVADPIAAGEVADTLAVSLNLNIVEQITAGQLTQKEDLIGRHDLLFIGYPEGARLEIDWPDPVSLGNEGFGVEGTTYDAATDTFFGVFAHPRRRDAVAAVFLPLSDSDNRTVARKITHYGKYSYLVFSRGNNRAKGYWPITQSPLIHEWPTKGESG